jgi:hypothetical protein
MHQNLFICIFVELIIGYRELNFSESDKKGEKNERSEMESALVGSLQKNNVSKINLKLLRIFVFLALSNDKKRFLVCGKIGENFYFIFRQLF